MFPKSVTLILYAEAVIACTKYVDCHNNIQQKQNIHSSIIFYS